MPRIDNTHEVAFPVSPKIYSKSLETLKALQNVFYSILIAKQLHADTYSKLMFLPSFEVEVGVLAYPEKDFVHHLGRRNCIVGHPPVFQQNVRVVRGCQLCLEIQGVQPRVCCKSQCSCITWHLRPITRMQMATHWTDFSDLDLAKRLIIWWQGKRGVTIRFGLVHVSLCLWAIASLKAVLK